MDHPDLRGPRLEKADAYGEGSAHYLRDMGDCIKLVKALGSSPPGDGGSHGSDAQAVVLVGGGLLCTEVAAAIAEHYP